MPNISDQIKHEAATEQQAKTQAAQQAVQNGVQDLAKWVLGLLQTTSPERGQVRNEPGVLNGDLGRLNGAARRLDQSNTQELNADDRQQLEDLASALGDIQNSSEKLDAVREQLDKDVEQLREAVKQPLDLESSDVQIEQRLQQQQRLDGLERTKAVADAADTLLRDTEVFDQLRQLNNELKMGRSPEETIQRLREFIDRHQQSPTSDEDRMRRIWVEAGGEGDLPK